MLSRAAIESRSRALLAALVTSKGNPIRQKIILKDISDHIITYPQSAELFRHGKGSLLALTRTPPDQTILNRSLQTLSLLGYAEPPRTKGLKILSIDGGGTRGLVCIELLRCIEKMTNKRIHELFDLICGVSSGAIITMAAGSGRLTLDECEQLYRDLSQRVFVADMWRAAPRLLMNHAYYDTSVWETILKQLFGAKHLISLSNEQHKPKLIAVAAIMNTPAIQPFLFRNYQPKKWSESKFKGSCNAEVWQAVRASSAAPGYFEEFKYGDFILQDGGVLVNNSTGIALSEANSIWPNETVQCIVSIGSGRFIPMNKPIITTGTSAIDKLTRLVESATDTEMIHIILHDLLPNGGYYRLNPTLSEYSTISENRKVKLDKMKLDTVMYIRKNEVKLRNLSESLQHRRPIYRRCLDWLRAQLSMWQGRTIITRRIVSSSVT